MPGMVTTCIVHPDRKATQQHCVAAIRDRKNLDRNWCVCCEECRTDCGTHDPHNHGGSIEDEWDRSDPTSQTGIRCKVCKIEIF